MRTTGVRVFEVDDLGAVGRRGASAGVEVTDHGTLRLLTGERRVLSLVSPAGMRVELHAAVDG